VKKDSYVSNDKGKTIGKDVTWTEAGKTEHYTTYTGTRTPKEHTGTTKHDGSRSTHERK